ncbi:MAG: hypothetical protein J5965_07530 [Aeriscardovia sp.]|nr:hypothetical protein [Aeriscardovia sp.]
MNGISEFTSINQLKPLIGKFDVNKIDENCKAGKTVGTKILSGLKPYFQEPKGNIKWFDCLTGIKKPAESLEEVQRHMLMYDPSLLYLATKRIDIWCQFKKNGQLFKNFEVVDTKGGGTKAGLAVNNEILSSIQNSDAVFSICLLENSTDYGIYEDLLRPKYKNDEIFMQKHFAILNPREGTDMANGREMMASFNLCNIAYGNSLVDGNAKDFSELVIANMLLRIATLVDNFDKDRIEKCNQAQLTINGCIDDLCSRMENIKPFFFDEKKAILEKVLDFIKEARGYVDGLMKEEATQTSKKEYKDYYVERATLYELITDDRAVIDIDTISKDPNKPKIDENKTEDDLIQDEIRKAINEVYNNLIPSVSINEEHVGQYIEEKLVLLNKRIARSVNRLSKQKEIGVQKRQEFFDKLWKIFKLDIIFQEEQWKDTLVKSCSFFEALNEVNVPMMDSPLSGKDIAHPYNVLRNYFKGDQTVKDNPVYNIQEKFEYGVGDEAYINDDRLKFFLTKEIFRSKVHELIVKKYNQSFDVVPTLCKGVRKILTGDILNANECYPFYAIHNVILDGNDRDKIELSKKWDELIKAKMSIKRLNISNIKLD